jgi:hypothetical protein
MIPRVNILLPPDNHAYKELLQQLKYMLRMMLKGAMDLDPLNEKDVFEDS